MILQKAGTQWRLQSRGFSTSPESAHAKKDQLVLRSVKIVMFESYPVIHILSHLVVFDEIGRRKLCRSSMSTHFSIEDVDEVKIWPVSPHTR